MTISRPSGFHKVFGYHASINSYRQGRGIITTRKRSSKPIEIRVHLQRADIEAAQRRRRAERLDVIVKDDATVRLPGESDLDVRGRRTQGQLAGLLRDSATALHVLRVNAMHPSDEL